MKKITQLTAVLGIFLLAMMMTGCTQHKVNPQLKSDFDLKLENLVNQTVASSRSKVSSIAPAAIVSKSALEGKPYTRLDEIIIQRLEEKLSTDREIVDLSRENWFELRERKPLSLKGHSYAHSDLMEGSIVYIVDVAPDAVFERVNVTITAKDENARKIPGIKGKTSLEYKEKSLATLLIKEKAQSNPIPIGLNENPYSSLEQLAYSMASELSASLKRGIESGKYNADKDEITVVLCSNSFVSHDPEFKAALIKELQHALVSMDGLNCAVSQEDFGALFSQIDFYKSNNDLFEIDHEKFKPGTVLLMAETASERLTLKKQVALRAMWRITPLKDDKGRFIATNSSGTYVSGFTSRAWFTSLPANRIQADPSITHPAPAPASNPVYKRPDKGFD